jgi:hypothetical protein
MNYPKGVSTHLTDSARQDHGSARAQTHGRSLHASLITPLNTGRNARVTGIGAHPSLLDTGSVLRAGAIRRARLSLGVMDRRR